VRDDLAYAAVEAYYPVDAGEASNTRGARRRSASWAAAF
jgi:hypothetical protein